MEDRHEVAVRGTFGMACTAARDGQYQEALEWLRTIEVVQGELAPEHLELRRDCERALGRAREREPQHR